MPDPDRRLDVRVSTPAREGLTGTAPANLYAPAEESEDVTTSPDGRPLELQPRWRKDFPIDAPQDQYVARRDFMKFLVLTSLAFSVGQFWIAFQDALRRRRSSPPPRLIGSLNDVPVGGAITFAYPEEKDRCILVRADGDVLVAYGQQCTHLSCAVVPQVEHNRLYCPCHEGMFDLRSGRPIAGPPKRPLVRVNLDVRGQDVFAISVDRRTV